MATLPLLSANELQEIEQESNELARKLRVERGLSIGAKGEKAIGAVLLSTKRPELTDCDLQRLLSVSRDSVRKYRRIIEEHSTGAGTKQQSALHPLVTPAWLQDYTPEVVGLTVVSVEHRSDGTCCRVLRASIASSSGTIEQNITVPYEPSTSAVEANQNREALGIVWTVFRLLTEPVQCLSLPGDIEHLGRIGRTATAVDVTSALGDNCVRSIFLLEVLLILLDQLDGSHSYNASSSWFATEATTADACVTGGVQQWGGGGCTDVDTEESWLTPSEEDLKHAEAAHAAMCAHIKALAL